VFTIFVATFMAVVTGGQVVLAVSEPRNLTAAVIYTAACVASFAVQTWAAMSARRTLRPGRRSPTTGQGADSPLIAAPTPGPDMAPSRPEGSPGRYLAWAWARLYLLVALVGMLNLVAWWPSPTQPSSPGRVTACAVGAAGLGAVFGLVMMNQPVWRPLAPPDQAVALLVLGAATGVCASRAAGAMAGVHRAGVPPAVTAVGVVAVALLGPAGMVSAAIIATQPPGRVR
jgi:hypothetical protein